jgi:hypothetical protein
VSAYLEQRCRRWVDTWDEVLRADEIAAHLLVLYDGTLARWAREAAVADLPGGHPRARARGLAAIMVAAVQPGRAHVGPSGPSTTTVQNVSDSASPM